MTSQRFHLWEEEGAPRLPLGEPWSAPLHDPLEQLWPRTLEKWSQKLTRDSGIPSCFLP